jgi:hypothetical protein
VLCAAENRKTECAEGVSRLDGHKGKRTSTLSVRDRTPEKKKGNLQPPCSGISQIGPNPSYFKCIFDHEGR